MVQDGIVHNWKIQEVKVRNLPDSDCDRPATNMLSSHIYMKNARLFRSYKDLLLSYSNSALRRSTVRTEPLLDRIFVKLEP